MSIAWCIKGICAKSRRTDSISAMHTKLNGIVKAALPFPTSCAGFCRSMEKFATMEWNEEELNRRKRVVTSFTEVVTTLQQRRRPLEAELQQDERRRRKVNFCLVNQRAARAKAAS